MKLISCNAVFNIANVLLLVPIIHQARAFTISSVDNVPGKCRYRYNNGCVNNAPKRTSHLNFSPQSKPSILHTTCAGSPLSSRTTKTSSSTALQSTAYPVSALAASTKAVTQLVATLFLGATAAHFKALPPSSLQAASKLIYTIFQPALLFSNVSTTLASASASNAMSLKTLLVLPAFSLVQVLVGYIIGKALIALRHSKAKGADVREILMSCTFGNSGPLPLLFVDAMRMGSAAVGYVSFYLLGWSPLFWTIGRNILTPPSDGDSAAGVNIGKILSPPVIGCIAGAVVGSMPIMNKLLLSKDAMFSPLMNAIQSIGKGYLPCVSLTLAGTLYWSLMGNGSDNVDDSDDDSVIAADGIPLWSKLFTLSLARFVLVPLAGIATINGLTKLSIIPSHDKLLRFVLMLQCCMPCAQNSVVILQLSEKTRKQAGSMAKTISFLYMLAMLPMAFWLNFTFKFAGI